MINKLSEDLKELENVNTERDKNYNAYSGFKEKGRKV